MSREKYPISLLLAVFHRLRCPPRLRQRPLIVLPTRLCKTWTTLLGAGETSGAGCRALLRCAAFRCAALPGHLTGHRGEDILGRGGAAGRKTSGTALEHWTWNADHECIN